MRQWWFLRARIEIVVSHASELMVYTTVFEDCGSRRISYRTIDCNDAIYGEFKHLNVKQIYCPFSVMKNFTNTQLKVSHFVKI